MRIIYLFCLMIVIGSCKDSAQQTAAEADSIKAQESIKLDDDQNAISEENNQTTASPSLNNNAFLSVFVKYVEDTYCSKEYKDDIYRCYELYDATLRSDFMQSIPITSNFPYDGSFLWDELSKEEGFGDYWSYKCGFYDTEKDKLVNFYCPNISSNARVWLDSLGQTNSFVEQIKEEYYTNRTFSPTSQREMILGAFGALDIENSIDHKAFFWMYHLTLTEEMLASMKVQN